MAGPLPAGSGRVRAVLTPRNDDAGAAPKATAPTAPLRKSLTLGGDKK